MIDFSLYKRLDIPEGRVKAITRKSDGIQLWKAGYVNQVPLSINSDGSIYNGTGYKEGYRLSSSGEEKAQSDTVVTGFISAEYGDVIRMKGARWGSDVSAGYSYIQYYNSKFGVVTQVNKYENVTANNNVSNHGSYVNKSGSSIVTDANGVTTFNIAFTTDPGFAYIRISATGSGADLIVTVNEEIE